MEGHSPLPADCSARATQPTLPARSTVCIPKQRRVCRRWRARRSRCTSSSTTARSIPSVAADVQRRVSDYLFSMADARPSSVHVFGGRRAAAAAVPSRLAGSRSRRSRRRRPSSPRIWWQSRGRRTIEQLPVDGEGRVGLRRVRVPRTMMAAAACSVRPSTCRVRRLPRARTSLPAARRPTTPSSSSCLRVHRRPVRSRRVLQLLFLAAIGEARDRAPPCLEAFSYRETRRRVELRVLQRPQDRVPTALVLSQTSRPAGVRLGRPVTPGAGGPQPVARERATRCCVLSRTRSACRNRSLRRGPGSQAAASDSSQDDVSHT